MKRPRLPRDLKGWYLALVIAMGLLLLTTIVTILIAYYLAFVEGPIDGVFQSTMTEGIVSVGYDAEL